MAINGKFRKVVAATALVVTMLGGAVGTVAAAPNTGGGPSAEQEHACLAAYHLMEWAKTKRKTPGDVYDRIANAAFDYMDANCDGVDFPQPSLGPPPRTQKPRVTVETGIVVTTGSLENSGSPVLTVEPFDNPIFWAVTEGGS